MTGSTYLELNPLKMFYYRRKSSRKVKDFQKLSNKESYFIFQSISNKYDKTFKFISWTNFLEEHHFQSPEIWGISFTDWFNKNYYGCMFSILAIIQHIIGNAPNVLWCKKFFHFKCNPVFRFNKLRFIATVLDSKENLLKTWNSLLNDNGNVNVQCS